MSVFTTEGAEHTEEGKGTAAGATSAASERRLTGLLCVSLVLTIASYVLVETNHTLASLPFTIGGLAYCLQAFGELLRLRRAQFRKGGSSRKGGGRH